MKKSMFRVLTLSLALSGVGVISSCKDYDEDLRTEVDSKIAGVDETIEDKVQELLKTETVIQNILNQITQCECGTNKPWMADIDSKIEEAKTAINTKYDALLEEITNKYNAMQLDLNSKLNESQVKALLGDYYSKAEIDAIIAGLPSSGIDLETLKNQLSNYLNKTQVETLLGGYYSKAEIDAIIAGLPTGGTTINLETLKSEISTYVLSQVQDQITKEFVLGLLGDKFDGYVDQATFDALKAQVDAMTSCGVACTELKTLVGELKDRIADAEAKIAENEGNITKLNTLYTDLDAYCKGLESKITAAQNAANKASDDAQKAQDAAEKAKSVADDALAKATSNATEINKHQEEINKLKTFQLTWETTLQSWKNDIPVLQSSVKDLTTRVEELEKEMAAVAGVATNALGKANDAYALAEYNFNEIKNISIAYNALYSTVETLTGRVDGVEGDVEKLKSDVLQNTQDIKDLMTAVGLNTEGLEELEKTVKKNREDFDKAVENLNKLTTLVNTVKSDLLALSGKVDGIASDVDGMKGDISSIQGDITSIQSDVNNLKNWSAEAKSQLEQILKDIEQNTKDIEQNAKDIKELQKTLDEAVKELKKMITSIEVQATKNPLFGSIYLPTGLQTNLLALWYGQALNDGVFPSYGKTAPYIWDTQALTSADKSIAGDPKNGAYEYDGGDILISDAEDNAGTIYATINPSNVDFTGVDMSLVNSLDEKSPFKLGAVKASNEKIQFGMTRANNAFYEIPVKVAAADVHKVNLGVAESVKDAVKNVVSNITSPKSISINKVATAVKDQISELSTDALGLKAWVEDDQRGVYSKYAIAGIAIKNPITYSSFKDFNYSTLPGYERVYNFIDRNVKTLQKKMKLNLHIDGISGFTTPELKEIKVELHDSTKAKFILDLSKEVTINDRDVNITFKDPIDVNIPISGTATVTTNSTTVEVKTESFEADVYDDSDNKIGTVTIPVQTATGTVPGVTGSGDFTGSADGSITPDNVTIHMSDQTFMFEYTVDLTDAINSVINDVNGSIADNINDYFSQIEDYVNKVNDALKEIDKINDKIDDVNDQIGNMIGTVGDKLKSLLESFNNRVVGLINSANDYLQPVLIANTSKGSKFLGSAKLRPSIINSSVTFYATNRFAEVVAPAFKRHLAVTNVYDEAGVAVGNAKSLANAVNSSADMNKVLDGKQIRVKASGFQKGYVYELAYSALDYTGKQVTHKYYVRVK